MTEHAGSAAPGGALFGIERLAALSDGVVAIAITLLILELKIPQVNEGQSLLAHLLEQRPEFIGWLISFVMIGVIWYDQHVVFSHVRGCDTALITINLAQLCFVSLLPFVSALVGDFPNDPGAVLAFSLVMVLNTMTMAANSAYVARRPVLHARGEAPMLRYRALFHLATGPFAALAAVAAAHLHHPLTGVAAWLIKPALVVAYHFLHQALLSASLRRRADRTPAGTRAMRPSS